MTPKGIQLLIFVLLSMIAMSQAQIDIFQSQVRSDLSSDNLGKHTSSADSDQDIIQKIFEGIFDQNKMQGPFMIKYCFDNQISHATVVFIGDFLAKAAKGSIRELVSLILQAKKFYDSLPQSFIQCLGKCQQIRSLGVKYDIDGGTDFTALQKKVAQYIMLHYLQVHQWMGHLNSLWLSLQYNRCGYYGAFYGHKVQHFSP